MNQNIKKSAVLAVFALSFGVLFAFAGSADAATVEFHLRHENTVFFEGEAELPVAGFTTLTDSDGVGHDINSQSVLNVLSNIDSASNDFSISTLQYFSSFSAFYVKCIGIPAKSVTACDNWQYVVGGTYPSVGMDAYVLTGGENIWIYFGDIRKAFPNQGSQKTEHPFSFTSEQYQYEINGWAPVTGYTIGIKKGGVVVATQAVDSSGKATFTVTEPGDYTAGVVEDFYFPSTAFYVDLFVPSLGPTGSAVPPPPPTPPAAEKTFDVAAALRFLPITDVPMLNDWAAIAGLDVKEYLLSDPNPGTLLTDYERRAMALLAQGINPYSGTPTNYIAKILEGFDGTQFGSKDLANDDMFALIPLTKAGYSLQDSEIEKTVLFILSWQQPNGSWSDVDNTAAAVQALMFAKEKSEVAAALDRAKLYLISQKKEDNSFGPPADEAGNAYSTSWALQALKALGENVSSSALADVQASDGGLLEADTQINRIWATAYAIPAAQGKSWQDILQTFPKTELQVGEKETEFQAIETVSERNSVSAEILLSIQTELEQIQLALEELRPQVALLYNQHLAKIEQEQRVASITQEIAKVQNQIVALQTPQEAELPKEAGPQKEVEPRVDEMAEERGSTSGIGASTQASVGSAFPVSRGLDARQIVLLIVAGLAIFFLAGGTNLLIPLLRKLPLKV